MNLQGNVFKTTRRKLNKVLLLSNRSEAIYIVEQYPIKNFREILIKFEAFGIEEIKFSPT